MLSLWEFLKGVRDVRVGIFGVAHSLAANSGEIYACNRATLFSSAFDNLPFARVYPYRDCFIEGGVDYRRCFDMIRNAILYGRSF